VTNRIGDRPRFPLPNQRFDKGDAEAISEYYESIISRFVGSMYGQAWGCVSNPQFYVESETVGGVSYYFVKMQKCVLLESVPDSGTLNTTTQDYGPWNARLVHYDPARTGQSLQLLNLFGLNGQRRWILFRRAETATGTSNKAYWDTTSNSEAIGAQPLVTSELVEFTTTLTYTESLRSAGWVRMAYIDSWTSPSAPVIIPVHWIDSQYYNDSTPPTQGAAIGVVLNSPNDPTEDGAKGFAPATEMPELAKVLHWVTGVLGQHYSTASTIPVAAATEATYNVKSGAFVSNLSAPGGWLSRPARGLTELHTGLTDMELAVQVLTAQLSSYTLRASKTPRLLASMYVTPVVGSVAPWSTATFDVSIDTSHTPGTTSSLAPSFGAPGSSADITYEFTPVYPGFELDAAGMKKVKLDLQVADPTVYVITSVDVSAHASAATQLETTGIVAHQFYAGGFTPPNSQLSIELQVQPSDNVSTLNPPIGLKRPFTVYIYGRNV